MVRGKWAAVCLAAAVAVTTVVIFAQQEDQPLSSSPPDTSSYVRQSVPEELNPPRAASLAVPIPGVAPPTVIDVVVNNTNVNLQFTDTFNDGECSIAVNPLASNQIGITAFSGGWGANAPLWYSTDSGNTWTKEFSIPVPPGVPSAIGCPCDQAIDFGRANILNGTFLAGNVYSGGTTNPASAAAWAWLLNAGVAQKTNATPNNPDQPWLLVNRDPVTAAQDNVYVAYDDFNTNPVTMRVAVSKGVNPPNFTVDQSDGQSLGGINPGHRLAVDPSNGTVYSLFQRNIAPGAGGSKNINYMLNRSTDGGTTWVLNGSPSGIIVANADSTQPTPKFGTVNALLGGVLHAAVDPNSGAVYYVYGNRDAATGNNRLAIRKLTPSGGNIVVGPQTFVTGQVQAAIPSVAVANNGIVGVFYYTFDGFSSPSNIPMFSAHLALSTDAGATFNDQVLKSFLSSATDNGNTRQRVFGDYMQLKAVKRTLYGVFTGNGAAFGRPISNHDPIFYTQNVNRPPVANAGPNRTVAADANCQAVVTLDGTASFDPDGDTLTYVWTGPFVVPASGIATGPTPTVTLAKGVNVITLTVTDPYGASSTAQVTITVNDVTPPVVTGVSASPNTLWPPNHKMVPVTINYNATDNCNSVNCTLSVASNEPPSGKEPDWQILDAHHILLRAERLGEGAGRVYTITISCVDGSGNRTVKSVAVTVPHDQGQ